MHGDDLTWRSFSGDMSWAWEHVGEQDSSSSARRKDVKEALDVVKCDVAVREDGAGWSAGVKAHKDLCGARQMLDIGRSSIPTR
jgi:hypothetical protein